MILNVEFGLWLEAPSKSSGKATIVWSNHASYIDYLIFPWDQHVAFLKKLMDPLVSTMNLIGQIKIL